MADEKIMKAGTARYISEIVNELYSSIGAIRADELMCRVKGDYQEATWNQGRIEGIEYAINKLSNLPIFEQF